MTGGRLLARLGLDVPPLSPGAEGDPGLFGPDSMMWTVGRERVLLLGGPAALLLQIAHPLVAAGVAAHSAFLADPFARLRATLDATLRITFGDRAQVMQAVHSVRVVHRRVRGRLPSAVGPYPRGTPYDATDPELALWVHATLVVAALDTFSRFVRPLDEEERERYHQEAKGFAALFGADADVVPATYADFRLYVRAMVHERLAIGDDARTLAATILHPPVPAGRRATAAMVRRLTAAMLPPSVRAAYGLEDRAPLRRPATTAARFLLRGAPAGLRYWPHYRVAVGRVGGGAWGPPLPLHRRA